MELALCQRGKLNAAAMVCRPANAKARLTAVAPRSYGLPCFRPGLSALGLTPPAKARSAVSYFNECVHCGSADRAQTCPAADRQKTKPSGREAQARRGDRDPPTPTDTAERSARARGEQARRREQRHPRLWPL